MNEAFLAFDVCIDLLPAAFTLDNNISRDSLLHMIPISQNNVIACGDTIC